MTTLAEVVTETHARHARRTAVRTDTDVVSFAELGTQARSVAFMLAERGLRPGDRVVIALENRPEVLALEHGLWLAGLVRVSVSPRLRPADVDRIARDCTARLVVCEPAIAAPFGSDAIVPGLPLDALLTGPSPQAAPRPSASDELVALMYTSGTSGAPKGARVTSGAWMAMIAAMHSVLPPITVSDRFLHVMPMSHFGGSVGSAYTLAGASAVPVRRFRADDVEGLVHRFGITATALVPTALDRLTWSSRADAAFPSLRAVVYGAAPTSTATQRRARHMLGDVLYQFYGLSEALAPLTALTPEDHALDDASVLASAGRPVEEVVVSVVNDEGRRLATGATGRVAVQGAQVFPGYWNAENRDTPDWVTGDLGFVDDAGYLHLVGRESEVIITGGLHVHPEEVERAIATLDAVAEVAVLGIPDAEWGETVAAAVVPLPGTTLSSADVHAACSRHLAPFKKPRVTAVIDALPRNSTGKVAKQSLRALFGPERTQP
ncbi:class I adenylate-forming enzyme family protein [Streptomyces sp. NPDC056405]|uniref:class I adenylate-forming enzyme family protein n=1 Tax=Streptomyces sp. NPDC056405 TaxID=3345811 RepID=UPI0035DD252A